MQASTTTLNDFFEIIKRRKWSLILPAFIIILSAAVVAVTLPSIFKSTSTILIEEQEIPADFVMATITSYAEQRLQTINQRITSYTRLLDMINRFNLYPDLRDKWTIEDIVAKMREDIELEPISTEVLDRRTGRPTSATIAFTLSYEGKDPATVERVTGELTSLFLAENLQDRERQTIGTLKFIEDEMEKVKADLAHLDAKVAIFKKQHINELPDLLQVNQQSLHNIETSIQRLREHIRNLKERKGYLQTQLASISPELTMDNRKGLDELKLELAQLKSRYSDEYPDVIKIKSVIAEVEEKLKIQDTSSGSSNDSPDNPAYITLASQLASTEADIDSTKRQIRDLEKMWDKYRRRIEATPGVEEKYNALIIEQKNTQAKYTDLMNKHMEARVAHGLEKEQKGERFTLIEPARLPEKPHKPNRKAILLIGFVLAIGAGGGAAFLRETTDQSVRNADTLTLATSFPVLASIPEIETRSDVIRKRIKRVFLTTCILLVIVSGVVAFHYLVMDLNIFWGKVMRRMSRMTL